MSSKALIHLYNDHYHILEIEKQIFLKCMCFSFHSNEKFEALKEVLHSSVFQRSWLSCYLEEIHICSVNLLTIRFRNCPKCINYLKSINNAERRKLITRSVSIIHRYYQWKLLIPDFFYFETETILNNDFDVSR